MATYDSAKVRRAATLMRRLSGSMETDVKSGLSTAAGCLVGFRGRTARAMEDRLDVLVRTSGDLLAELDELARQINAYADVLEETDEQLARKL